MLNQNQTNMCNIHEAFEPFIQRVLGTKYFGVSRGTMRLNSIGSSGKNKADRFNLSVPYAGQLLEWTVIFNSNCPEMGPDFEFHNDLFMADPNIDTIAEQIPSLADWQPLDRDCLLNVLAELTQCYKQYQLDMLGRLEQRLQLEYEMVIEKTEICPQDVEIILLPNETTPIEARFVIRLAMDFSRLPGRSNKANDDDAMLIISFQQPNWSRISPQLYLTNPLEEVFGGPGTMHIPPYGRDKCVMEYVTEVKKAIEIKIDMVATCFEKRRNFIAGMLFMQRRNIVEYDAEDFSRISILVEVQDFYFLVHFRLPPSFPKDQPMVILQSVYHMTAKDELYSMKISHYPYSPRWDPLSMIQKMLTKIFKEDVPKFRATSLSASLKRG